MKTIQYITKKGTFDSMHRVMNECMKCFNVHGHTYLYELKFQFNQMEDIGYAIDFKEIKRVACQWIDDILDHGAILNPKDNALIEACKQTKSKLWLMSLNGANEYCNPSVENIAKEVFLAISMLLDSEHLSLHKIRLWETPSCYTDCIRQSISPNEKQNFIQTHSAEIQTYKEAKGTLIYDDRVI
jgi:6-pyruvoyltetrahydropterin/6-carboxytetrahydropterin synthase